MPNASERRARQHRGADPRDAAREISTPQTDRPPVEEGLLNAVWEALNVARENKALVMACHSTIICESHQPEPNTSLNSRVTVDCSMTCLLERSGR